jgi:hypothetical protein
MNELERMLFLISEDKSTGELKSLAQDIMYDAINEYTKYWPETYGDEVSSKDRAKVNQWLDKYRKRLNKIIGF